MKTIGDDMWEKLWDVFLDASLDTLKTLPFLLAVYILIEYIEHKSADKLGRTLRKMGPFGSVGGALLGSIPQCGFSAAASNLYAGRLVTMGTLIAVYISTSDEAIPLMIQEPDFAPMIWKLILVKIGIAMAAGILTDNCIKLFIRKKEEEPFKELCADCDCEHHGILHSALHHTIHIIIFIFVINLLLGCVMEFAGEQTVEKLMMTNSWVQPLIAGVIGFIPNCGASVVLTKLYTEGVVSFGALVAGLSTGAGVGLLILFKTNKNIKQNLIIMGILYGAAVTSGLLIQAFS
ncbi:MAG: arsenic efflux protein [Ruminococcus sp.]|nr:arsenic efflux protein [Ruminococcus sp.]